MVVGHQVLAVLVEAQLTTLLVLALEHLDKVTLVALELPRITQVAVAVVQGLLV
jgi:hypothetical protein